MLDTQTAASVDCAYDKIFVLVDIYSLLDITSMAVLEAFIFHSSQFSWLNGAAVAVLKCLYSIVTSCLSA
jgi:hypothetical protein